MKNEEILKKTSGSRNVCERSGVVRTIRRIAHRHMESNTAASRRKDTSLRRKITGVIVLWRRTAQTYFRKIELESKLETAWVGRKLVFPEGNWLDKH